MSSLVVPVDSYFSVEIDDYSADLTSTLIINDRCVRAPKGGLFWPNRRIVWKI